MKKTIFIGSLFFAGMLSAKDIEITKEKKDDTTTKIEANVTVRQCGVAITYWSGGQVVGYQEVYSDQPTLEDCQKFQAGVKAALAIAGFWVV